MKFLNSHDLIIGYKNSDFIHFEFDDKFQKLEEEPPII